MTKSSKETIHEELDKEVDYSEGINLISTTDPDSNITIRISIFVMLQGIA